MTPELQDLLKYLKKTKDKSFKKIAKLTSDIEVTNKAPKITDEEYIEVNINELLPLITPEDFTFSADKVGLVATPKD